MHGLSLMKDKEHILGATRAFSNTGMTSSKKVQFSKDPHNSHNLKTV